MVPMTTSLWAIYPHAFVSVMQECTIWSSDVQPTGNRFSDSQSVFLSLPYYDLFQSTYIYNRATSTVWLNIYNMDFFYPCVENRHQICSQFKPGWVEDNHHHWQALCLHVISCFYCLQVELPLHHHLTEAGC